MIARYLDTTDRKSTGNMHKHVCFCWGPDILDIVDQVKNLEGASVRPDVLTRVMRWLYRVRTITVESHVS